MQSAEIPQDTQNFAVQGNEPESENNIEATDLDPAAYLNETDNDIDNVGDIEQDLDAFENTSYAYASSSENQQEYQADDGGTANSVDVNDAQTTDQVETLSYESPVNIESNQSQPDQFSEDRDPVTDSFDEDAIDPEIIEIFVEEADELLEEIDDSVHAWEMDWSLSEPIESLKRVLHTFKGGARLAGLMGIGEQAHDFETFIIELGDANNVDDAFFARIHQYQDQLLKGMTKVKAGDLSEALALPDEGFIAVDEPVIQQDNMPTTDTLMSESSVDNGVVTGESAVEGQDDLSEPEPADNTTVVEAPASEPAPDFVNNIVPFERPKPATSTPSPLQARRAAPQEMVKVSSDLLEELVNLAGETAIGSGRVEEQVSEIGGALDEMSITLNRLQEQLRRLDIETEAQILFRQEQMQQLDDFDPLEMDRYSQLQQLSRSLIESASDLLDLKSTLVDKKRDTETLLLQQSRVNSELQEGLMRSRMVPFSRMVPRLRRIVRQVAGELNKTVSLEMENVEGEMDRSILERMVAPLEHMLRNAVDHGIEKAQQRYERGKPENGRIVLALSREGGDVVIRLADDGQGIDLNRVKEKAIERGLMSAEAKLNDHDIMQFILHAGFSTADKVTQISGRGVGMDVVHSEIKQLGGSMSINSVYGQGTEFVIRLPFTVSVNRALMVRIGEARYAIPLNTIEGIVRINPFELEYYYENTDARFDYAGENYQVRYLGGLLNVDERPSLEGHALPLPVVLVRSAEHSVAVQVDSLMGSREIVVKTLGQQFSAVQGLSGATVMGDGSVVVILDPHAMIRKEIASIGIEAVAPETALLAANEDQPLTVMVVDDSVTVRKVTSRFLEREGFIVVTAKDGADAMVQLQTLIPDVMLLDIEMPRMDGFEVAKNIRTSSRLQHLPIIMITSRTGEKHRERAMELGVNRYLGKPYQEDLLMETIHELLEPVRS